MNIFLFAETLEKLSKKEEQCSSLTTESESLRSQLAGEDIYTAFYNVKCFVSRTQVMYLKPTNKLTLSSLRTGKEVEGCR